jgi:uncharacterized protein YdaU (DUF1376 family)
MSAFPHLPLFTDAWIADTKHLARLERGTYLDLLVLMWRTPTCRVPNDDAWLGKRLGMTADEVTSELRPIITEFCQVDGNWITQKRLKREWDWCLRNSKKRSDAAKSRWQKEKAPSKRNTAQHVECNAPSLSDPIEKEDGDDVHAHAHTHAHTRDPEKRIEPLVPPEAFELVYEIASVAGVDPKNAWFGACHIVSAWLREPGWTRDAILTGVRRGLAKHRDGPIYSIRFFEREIAMEVARQARPLPVAKVLPAQEITVGDSHAAIGKSHGARFGDRPQHTFATYALACARAAAETDGTA